VRMRKRTSHIGLVAAYALAMLLAQDAHDHLRGPDSKIKCTFHRVGECGTHVDQGAKTGPAHSQENCPTCHFRATNHAPIAVGLGVFLPPRVEFVADFQSDQARHCAILRALSRAPPLV
jgi:hypothetical protein